MQIEVTPVRQQTFCHFLNTLGLLFLSQILQRSGGGAFSLWHSQTPDLWERGALAEGAEGPRRQQHCHHAGWQQERPAPPQGRAHRRGPGLRRYRSSQSDTRGDVFISYLLQSVLPVALSCCSKTASVAVKDMFSFLPHLEKNNLSFIETSALDSTNVEEAFKNILTGMLVNRGATAELRCWYFT